MPSNVLLPPLGIFLNEPLAVLLGKVFSQTFNAANGTQDTALARGLIRERERERYGLWTSSLPPVVTDLNVIPSCNFEVQFAYPHKVKQYTGIKEVSVVYVVFALTLFLVSFAVSTPQPFSHVVKELFYHMQKRL